MKQKLLLFVVLLMGMSARAANGALSVANMTSVVPGTSGSFDIVLSGADVQYAGFQFDLTLPEKITLATPITSASFAKGALLTDHAVVVSDQGSNRFRFTGVANPTANFTAMNGTIINIKFSVASDATGTLSGSLSTVRMTNSTAVSYTLPDVSDIPFVIGSTVSLSEDDTEAPAASGGAVDVTVNRAFNANTWHTLVLPFAMTNAQLKAAFGDDVQLGSFAGYTINDNSIQVSFTSSTELAAHTPYIIKMSAAKSSFTVSGVTITAATNNLTADQSDAGKEKKMIGTYAAETAIPDKGLFILNNEFKYSKGNSKLKAYHAYFSFADFDYAAAAGAPSVTIDYFEMSTGINAISGKTAADGNVYNVNGQRVSESAKGLQIRDGKKVMKK